jgi:hypothetical protein
MSIAALTQVYDEMRRLAIAGSNLAAADFRLKKLIPPLEASAAKAPVFGKVAEAAQKLVDSTPQNSAEALLELSTLVSAILYTQGETGIEGKLEPIETADIGIPSSTASARVLKPLVEALTTTGSGREEIIRDASQRGAFNDLRLVRPAVGAVDDPYGPIADFVCDNVLPIYGKAIYDDLRASYNPKAKGGQVRRLRIMHRLDPEATHELVEQALESGSADMKVAAIRCLEGREDMLSYLLEQSKAKSKDVRQAAISAMAKFNNDEVIDSLTKALSGADLELAAESVSQSRSPRLLQFLLEETERQADEIMKIKEKAKLKKGVERLYHLLACFASRDDKQTIALLRRLFERREEIAALKSDFCLNVNERVAALLVQSNVKEAQKRVADAHPSLPPPLLEWAVIAAVRTRKPKEVFDDFSPYYLQDGGKKKRGDTSAEKRDIVRDVISTLAAGPGAGRYYYYLNAFGRRHYHSAARSQVDFEEFAQGAGLDPRWLDAAMERDDLGLAMALARPKHKPSQEYLSRKFEELLQKKGEMDYFQTHHVLDAMIRIEHPRTVEHFLAALEKLAGSKRHYYVYWLARIIPALPAAAAPKIEAMLPKMNDKVVDQIAPFLTELQTKA